MCDVRTYVVTVAMTADGARSDLLAMAAVLSRRHIAVLEATLARPVQGRRVFTATFQASPIRAQSLLRTFQSQVDTVDARLVPTTEQAADATGPRSPGRATGSPMHFQSTTSAAKGTAHHDRD
jgi:hypothetical protein